MANTNTSNKKTMITVLIIIVVALAAWAVLTMPDNRTGGEKVGDAIDSFDRGEGIGDSARELQDRTPGERLGDSIKDATDGE